MGIWSDSLVIIDNPEDDKIKQILSYTGSDKIELDYPFIKTNPDVQLDLNAIAKGYAVDLVYGWFQKVDLIICLLR